VKDKAHPLELVGYMPRLLFVGVTHHNEMWGVNLQPTFRLGACGGGQDSRQ
jgi:hypothetical protein